MAMVGAQSMRRVRLILRPVGKDWSMARARGSIYSQVKDSARVGYPELGDQIVDILGLSLWH